MSPKKGPAGVHPPVPPQAACVEMLSSQRSPGWDEVTGETGSRGTVPHAGEPGEAWGADTATAPPLSKPPAGEGALARRPRTPRPCGAAPGTCASKTSRASASAPPTVLIAVSLPWGRSTRGRRCPHSAQRTRLPAPGPSAPAPHGTSKALGLAPGAPGPAWRQQRTLGLVLGDTSQWQEVQASTLQAPAASSTSPGKTRPQHAQPSPCPGAQAGGARPPQPPRGCPLLSGAPAGEGVVWSTYAPVDAAAWLDSVSILLPVVYVFVFPALPCCGVLLLCCSWGTALFYGGSSEGEGREPWGAQDPFPGPRSQHIALSQGLCDA